MTYKWKPNRTQSKAFKEKMEDPLEKAKYEAKKETKAAKRRSTSKFDYSTAGGSYIPTKAQYDMAIKFSTSTVTFEQKEAVNQVIYGYSCNEKVHHDHIHIINELIRSNWHI